MNPNPAVESKHVATPGSADTLEFIDSLRGIAISLVIVVHASQSFRELLGSLQSYATFGARGVQLFYVASAFTLLYSIRTRRANEVSSVRNFYIRRLFRIAPLYYLGLIFYGVRGYGVPNAWMPAGVEWWHFPVNILFLQAWHPATGSTVPGGATIGVEMMFYVILPFLAARLNNIKRTALFLLVSIPACGLASAACRSWAIETGIFSDSATGASVDIFFHTWMISQLPVFAAGMFAYFAWESCAKSARPRKLLAAMWASASLLFVCIRDLLEPIGQDHTLVALGFACGLVGLSLYPTKILVNPVMRLLGRLSYSMYISHWIVIEILSKRLHFEGRVGLESYLKFVAVLLLITGLTAAISEFLFRTVEQPGIRLGRHLINNLMKGK